VSVEKNIIDQVIELIIDFTSVHHKRRYIYIYIYISSMCHLKQFLSGKENKWTEALSFKKDTKAP